MVAVLVAAMAFYIVLIGYRGLYLLVRTAGWWPRAALRPSQQAAGAADARGGKSTELPALPQLLSGRMDRSAADAWFEQQREAVHLGPRIGVPGSGCPRPMTWR